jgi:RNA polymerase sigma-70 factor (ECF subfamily)
MKVNGDVSGLQTSRCKDPIEADLITRMGLGDKEAFSVIFTKYEKQLYRTAVRITRNNDDAWDGLQDAYLNAYLKFHSFRSDATISTWLTRIVINSCLIQLRKRRVRPAISLDDREGDGMSWAESVTDGMADAEEQLIELEALELLEQAITALQPNLQCVMRSYRSGDHSMIELAAKCGITLPAVKSRMLRGRRAIRKFGEEYYQL